MTSRRILNATTFTVVALLAASLQAASIAPSFAINFGADEPDGAGSAVNGAAGVLETATWNNLSGNEGGPVALNLDTDGVSSGSDVMVSWTSNNTWSSTGRGEENNTAPDGNDRNLMTGYLDTNDTSVTTISVSGLDASFTDPGYSVIVYMKGGVNGRGGQYTVTTPNQVKSLSNEQMQAFDGEFVAGESFFVFTGLTSTEFQLTGTPTIGDAPRAPINGIEIVAVVPEPSTVIMLGMGLVGLVELVRRARRA
jgi:hypothetical protein